MAATPHRRLSRWVLSLAAALLLAIGLYGLAAWVGSSIPRNAAWAEPTAGVVTIAVETNGVHTALVLPLVTPIKDWRRVFPPGDVARPDRPYTHISISWGERSIFLDTPTWRDLSPGTVLRVLTRGGEGLAHVAFYVRPASSETLRPIRLTPAQYARLVASIEQALAVQGRRQSYPGYGGSDVFYDAAGRYTAIRTCNQWTANRLADAGVRIGRWTPFAGGVMKWFKPAASEQTLSRPDAMPAG